jgi:hypothetical protein
MNSPRSPTRAPSRIVGMARLVGVAALTLPRTSAAEADATLPGLLAKLEASSKRFEAMLAQASFTAVGRTEELDSDGRVSDVREGVFRFVAAGDRHVVDVVRYTESGKDETAAAREKARDAAKKRPDPDAALRLPFLASEQPKYTFQLGETDPRDPGRVRVHFTARKPALTSWNGSAWVDSRTGDILTMAGAQSKTGMFVDYFQGTVELGEHTKQGFAPSKVTFEGAGSFLFFHHRFRGWATLSGYVLSASGGVDEKPRESRADRPSQSTR